MSQCSKRSEQEKLAVLTSLKVFLLLEDAHNLQLQLQKMVSNTPGTQFTIKGCFLLVGI